MSYLKEVLFSFLLLLSFTAKAELSFKWLGISGFVLSDEETTLVFDPAMTRVGLLDYLPFKTVKSDEVEVDYWLKRCGVTSVDGIFVNHAHADHVIDAPYIVRKYGGKLYGSSSVVNVGLGQGLKDDQVQEAVVGQEWKVGDFTITPFFDSSFPPLYGDHADGRQY